MKVSEPVTKIVPIESKCRDARLIYLLYSTPSTISLYKKNLLFLCRSVYIHMNCYIQVHSLLINTQICCYAMYLRQKGHLRRYEMSGHCVFYYSTRLHGSIAVNVTVVTNIIAVLFFNKSVFQIKLFRICRNIISLASYSSCSSLTTDSAEQNNQRLFIPAKRHYVGIIPIGVGSHSKGNRDPCYYLTCAMAGSLRVVDKIIGI